MVFRKKQWEFIEINDFIVDLVLSKTNETSPSNHFLTRF